MDYMQDTTRCENCGSDKIVTSVGLDVYVDDRDWQWWIGSFTCRSCGYRFQGQLLEERIVYVVSFAPTTDEGGIGGFDWYPQGAALVAAMRWHKAVSESTGLPPYRWRLLRLRVPADHEPEEVTKYLDDDIDFLELEAAAILDITV